MDNKIKDEITPRRTLGSSNGHRPTPAVSKNGHAAPLTPEARRDKIKRLIRAKFEQGKTYEAISAWLTKVSRRRDDPLLELELADCLHEVDDEVNPAPHEDATPAPERTAAFDGGEYFRVHNAIFDWNLPVPPAHKLVWLCLHRFANNRTIQRTVQKITQERIGAACGLQRRVVSVAIRCLVAIGAIGIFAPARTKPDGTRLTAVYHVPVMLGLHQRTLKRAIERVRREQPDLFLLHPDQARRDRAKRQKRAAPKRAAPKRPA